MAARFINENGGEGGVGFACLAALGSNPRDMMIAVVDPHPCGADLRSVCAAARRSHPEKNGEGVIRTLD